MRSLIQVLLFACIYFVLFEILKWCFNHVDLGLSMPQLSVVQLFLMMVIFVVALVVTKLLSKWIKKKSSL